MFESLLGETDNRDQTELGDEADQTDETGKADESEQRDRTVQAGDSDSADLSGQVDPYCVTLKPALDEVHNDALVLLNQSQSRFLTIPTKEDSVQAALFQKINDPFLNSLTAMAMQLIVTNWIILVKPLFGRG